MNVDEKGSADSIESYADVWDLSSRTRVARIPQNDPDAYVSFDPSGKRLLTADQWRSAPG
jgi:hypothetical protein